MRDRKRKELNRFCQAQRAELKESQKWVGSRGEGEFEKIVEELEFFGIRRCSVRGKVLDIGAGPVAHSRLFDKAALRVSVDTLRVDDQAAEILKVVADGIALPFPSNSFDLVIARNVIDHMLAPRALLREAHRVLKSDGRLYLMVNTFLAMTKPFFPILGKLDKPHPIHFTLSDVISLLKNTKLFAEKDSVRRSGHFELRVKRIIGMLLKREYSAILRKKEFSCTHL